MEIKLKKLEKELSEPFRDDYIKILNEARMKVQGEDEV
jgi:hypothetical protein